MPGLGTAADGMGVEQKFMEVISRNLANAEVTHTPEGGPYRREVAQVGVDPVTGQVGVQVVQDPGHGRMVYDPSHPDANAQGFVEYPNVDIDNEIVDLMIVRRVHEANVSVFQAAKAMLRRALDI